jgi:hypothetical protein
VKKWDKSVLAAAAILWLVFKVVPQKQKQIFIVPAIKIALGWIVWMDILCPAILP